MSDASSHIESLFRSYYARLCYFATRMTGDAGVAEDIVQEAFLKFWKIRQDIKQETAVKSYLYSTIRNVCLNHLRHQDVVKRHIDSTDSDDMASAPVIEEIVRAELLGEVYAAIESLPEGCRTILKMAYFEKLGNDEIATQLDISINTVKTQKMRALQLLRLRLDPLTITLFLLIRGTGELVQ